MLGRNRLLLLALGGVVAAAGAGWFAGSRVQSPADAAASAREPTPSAITARVERKTLATTIVTRGTARFSEPLEVALAASSANGGSAIVTKAPEEGASLAEGSVAMEVSGRPVFTLQGDQPMYRDIIPGATGQDVLQLEQALARLGFDPGDQDGVYDMATAAAVVKWFTAAGFQAVEPTDAQQRDLRTARDAVTSATNRLRDARQALTDRQKPPSEVDLLTARNDVRAAQDALPAARAQADRDNAAAATAITDRTTALTLAREGAARDLANARTDVATKAAQLDLARTSAQRDVTAAQTTITTTAQAREDANAALSRAQGRYYAFASGYNPDTGKPSTAAELTQAQAALDQAKSAYLNAVNQADAASRNLPIVQQQTDLAVKRAQQELDTAKQTLADLPAKNDRTIRTAEADVVNARSAATAARDKGAGAIASAESQVSITEARLARLLEPPDVASLETAASDAARQLTQAQTDYDKLSREIGISVPASSVVFLPSLPVRVDAATVARGESAAGKVMTVTGSNLTVVSSVTVNDAKLLKVGAMATIDASDAGITVEGEVTKIADKPGTNNLDAQHVYVELTPATVPAGLRDAAVRVTIPVQSTGGDVLAVPVAAISTMADGASFVQVSGPSGAVSTVKVRPGLAASGLVKVTPTEGELKAGDRVVVGREQAAAK